MRIIIVGPGRAGGAIAIASHLAGHDIVGVYARRPEDQIVATQVARVAEPIGSDLPDAELMDRTLEKASEIAKQPLSALRRTKQLLLDVRVEALAATRRREDPAMAKSIGTPANVEAIRAFREKRAVDFTGM